MICLWLAMALLLTACGPTADPPPVGNRIGDTCIAATLTEIGPDGYTDHTFDPTQRGKITVINFWAHWCPPCVQELPHFERVAQEMTDTVDVITIHCDAVEQAQEFIAEQFPESSIIFAMDAQNDPFVYYSALGGSGSIPYTLILDADGVIRHTFTGAITYDTLTNAVNSCR